MAVMVANVGVAMAGLVSCLWIAAICSSMHWVSSRSLVVSFKATLLSVYTEKGDVASIVSFMGRMAGATSLTAKLDQFMERELWFEDAMTEFCSTGLEATFHWCNMWTMATYGSWFMLFCIIVTVCMLLMGAGFMYYYSNVHATTTGRVCCRVCYGMAPVFALVGLMVYTGMTFEFGKDGLLKNGFQAQSLYSGGYIFGWSLSLFSWVPLYTMVVFMRRDPLEKKHWADDPERLIMEQQSYAGIGPDEYGAMGGGYGASAADPYATPAMDPYAAQYSDPYGAPAAQGMLPQNAQNAQGYAVSGAQAVNYGNQGAPPQSGGSWTAQPGYGAAPQPGYGDQGAPPQSGGSWTAQPGYGAAPQPGYGASGYGAAVW